MVVGKSSRFLLGIGNKMSKKTTISLPEHFNISQGASMRDKMDKTLDKDADTIEIKADKVERADSAGIQLLLSFRATAVANNKKVTFSKPSEELLAAVKLLGASELLGLQE